MQSLPASSPACQGPDTCVPSSAGLGSQLFTQRGCRHPSPRLEVHPGELEPACVQFLAGREGSCQPTEDSSARDCVRRRQAHSAHESLKKASPL